MVEFGEEKPYKKLRYKYLRDKLPDTEENLKEKYWDNFKETACFVQANLYKWGSVYASDPLELYLMGILKREGIHYEHD